MVKIFFFHVIPIYALSALCSVSLVNAVNAKVGVKVSDDNPGYSYLQNGNALKEHGFESIKWVGGLYGKISLGDVVWNNHHRFLKCIWHNLALREDETFKILKEVEDDDLIQGDMAKGRAYIQQPVHRFEIPELSANFDYQICYIYSFAEGKELDSFSDEKSWAEKALLLPQVFYQVAQAAMYFRYANLVHYDFIHENIIVEESPNLQSVKVTVIDFDFAKLLVKRSFLSTKKLVPLENLDGKIAYPLCSDDNKRLSMKIFRSITGVFPFHFVGGIVHSYNKLLEIFQLTAQMSVQMKPSQFKKLEELKSDFIKSCQDPYDKPPNIPTKFDTVAAKKLLNLLEFMVALNRNDNPGCLIPIKILTTS